MKKIITLLLILSGSTITYAQSDSSLASLPDVTLKNVEGTDVNIADYGKNGKITVISFGLPGVSLVLKS